MPNDEAALRAADELRALQILEQAAIAGGVFSNPGRAGPETLKNIAVLFTNEIIAAVDNAAAVFQFVEKYAKQNPGEFRSIRAARADLKQRWLAASKNRQAAHG